jgi:hypothetical protein
LKALTGATKLLTSGVISLAIVSGRWPIANPLLIANLGVSCVIYVPII